MYDLEFILCGLVVPTLCSSTIGGLAWVASQDGWQWLDLIPLLLAVFLLWALRRFIRRRHKIVILELREENRQYFEQNILPLLKHSVEAEKAQYKSDCYYFDYSSLLHCAVHPEADCQNCGDYEPRKY